MVENRLGVVITIWKDINKIQVVSNTITKVVGKVTRSKGGDSITLKLPKCIIKYQKHIGVFDRGYQYRLMGQGLQMYHTLKIGTRNHFLGFLVLVSYMNSCHGTWR